jgi:hypothetical protein
MSISSAVQCSSGGLMIFFPPRILIKKVSWPSLHIAQYVRTHPRRIVGLCGGSTTRNLKLDGHDQWPALTGQAPPPRTEMLYGVSPVRGGLAGPPQAGLRIGDYKVLCWTYVFPFDPFDTFCKQRCGCGQCVRPCVQPCAEISRPTVLIDRHF